MTQRPLEELETGTLTTVSWDDAHTLTGVTWLWMDNDGVHDEERLPVEPPYTTHVWGWSANAWYRFRVSGGTCIGAKLTSGQNAGQEVQFATYMSKTRSGKTEASMMPSAPQLRDQPLTIRQVFGSHPLTFVEVTAKQGTS